MISFDLYLHTDSPYKHKKCLALNDIHYKVSQGFALQILICPFFPLMEHKSL